MAAEIAEIRKTQRGFGVGAIGGRRVRVVVPAISVAEDRFASG